MLFILVPLETHIADDKLSEEAMSDMTFDSREMDEIDQKLANNPGKKWGK